MRIFLIELPEVVAGWLRTQLALGLRDPAFAGAQRFTPTGAGYESIAIAQHRPSGSQLIYSRDVGHHTSGWFKNPDYERCRHLSISYLWTEPPFTEQGKRDGVWHFRVFCDQGWQPLMPRGEVYSRELTERGWRSFSEVRELRAREERPS